jgi:hypothetical protein
VLALELVALEPPAPVAATDVALTPPAPVDAPVVGLPDPAGAGSPLEQPKTIARHAEIGRPRAPVLGRRHGMVHRSRFTAPEWLTKRPADIWLGHSKKLRPP